MFSKASNAEFSMRTIKDVFEEWKAVRAFEVRADSHLEGMPALSDSLSECLFHYLFALESEALAIPAETASDMAMKLVMVTTEFEGDLAGVHGHVVRTEMSRLCPA